MGEVHRAEDTDLSRQAAIKVLPDAIRHRWDCGLTLEKQAPLIGAVLRKVIETDGEDAGFRTLSWGRLHPDGARDATMAVRLAVEARLSP